ncbi:methyltransferase domain-containing protein [Micromonospora sp. WMMD980]|uniref:class I SAM-dependent methyltransferase n=1 Tax=Micromonospora sp. WMMD980 TaxID=3016088 RepID=UPI0024180129|nr:methyltransferase domain-containing protein [Micromonospora sp. WMMD980]MDG4803700.1 methyltransferase domain-containing protein [Micromonospora sp. WMMD980]
MSAPLRELLDPTITHQINQLDLNPGSRVLEIGAGTGHVTALLARAVGPLGRVVAVDDDTTYLKPSAVVDVYGRDVAVNPDAVPGDAESIDLVVARWPHHRLVDPAALIDRMLARLRPGGWLVLADVTDTRPRVHRADTSGDEDLINRVVRRLYDTTLGAGGTGRWPGDVEGLLHGRGMERVCLSAASETWTGGGPGCGVLAGIVDHARTTLRALGVHVDDIDYFQTVMADPHVLLRSIERRGLHARKPA